MEKYLTAHELAFLIFKLHALKSVLKSIKEACGKNNFNQVKYLFEMVSLEIDSLAKHMDNCFKTGEQNGGDI